MELVGRVLDVVAGDHRVLEAEQHPRVDLEREVEVDRALAPLLGVEVDLPVLAQRVALDEVPLVVHVEAVLDRVVLEIGDEAGDVDDCHAVLRRTERAAQRGDRVVERDLGRRRCKSTIAEEPVDHAVVARHLDGVPASRSAAGVRLALVAQRVVLGGDHERRAASPREVRRAQRRDARVARLRRVARGSGRRTSASSSGSRK